MEIGDQCWFAENLRSTILPKRRCDSFRHGGRWNPPLSVSLQYTARAASTCYNYSPDIDACDEAQSLEEYGRLYNWYAVDDARGLCPSGWHVPTDGEWTDWRITSLHKASAERRERFEVDVRLDTGGNGTDDFGFSALPGGYRFYDNGYFYDAGSYGYWWSSSPSGGDAWYRTCTQHPDIYRYRTSAVRLLGQVS